MAHAPLTGVFRHLRNLLGRRPTEAEADGRLLERFARGHDQAAFAALMARHGPMVLGVCRRVLHNEHDAEDVFQAAFIVLARRARALDGSGSVANWLHTVAYRLALRARVGAARRRALERQAVDMPRPEPSSSDLVWRDLRPVLDEELGRLPEKYRAPLILCYLEGKTTQEAARQIGCPFGTVSSRLARGRDLLRQRLVRRGLAPSAVALASLLAPDTLSAAVPASLLNPTLQAASLVAAGRAAASAGLSAPAVALVEGAFREMMLTKWKVAVVILLVAGLVAVGAGVVHSLTPADRPNDAPPAAAAPQKQPPTDVHGDPLPVGALARVGTVRLQHEGGIHCNCFTPDNRILATGGLDGVIRFWDVATGKEVRRFRGHTMHILCLAFTPDGKVMASASWDTTVRLWDTASGQELRSLIGHVDAAICVAFAPDGRTLVTTDRGNAVRQWSTATGKEVRAFVGHENFVNSLAFSPDGRTLFSSAFDQRRRQGGPVFDERARYAIARLRVWEVVTARERRVIDLPEDVRNVWLSPDGRRMAQDLKNKTVRVVDVASGKELGKFPGHEPFTYSVAFAPDGRTVAAGSYDRLLRLCDVAGGKVLREAQLDLPVTALGFSPDGKLLASGTGPSARFWDARTGQERVPVPMLKPIKAVSLSPDGKTLATAGDEKLLRVEAAIDAPHVPSAPAAGAEKLVRLWDADTGKAIRTLAGHTSEVVAVAFSADGKTLATAGADGAGRLWDTATGAERQRWSAPRGLTALAFAPDDKTLATGGTDKAIRLWDAATGKEIRVLSGHGRSVAGLAFAPDGRTLASAGGDDCTARLWDVATGKELRRLVKRPPAQRIGNRTPRPPAVESVAFSPDGKTVAVSLVGRTIRLVRAATGAELLTLGGDLPLSVTALAFSPDGKTLAAGGWGMNVAGGGDPQVRLWDASTGKLERRLDGHTRQVTALSFSADGNRLASGSTDRTALVWDLTRPAEGRDR